jgi:hypothetical protein
LSHGAYLLELKAYNVPEISVPIGTHLKRFPNLGQRTLNFEGDTVIDSGTSISGMVYYVYECWGHSEWDPEIRDGQIMGTFITTNAFGQKNKCRIRFSERPLDEIKKNRGRHRTHEITGTTNRWSGARDAAG